MARIQVREVAKVYQAVTSIRALDCVDMDVADGEFVALLGPSGCGKSTLLNILAGFEKSTEGVVLIDDEPVGPPGPDRGVVFQDAALFPWLTVYDNVTFGPRIQGVDRAEYDSRTREMLSIVGLSEFADSYPSQLSGGMRQRVGIARVLVMRPRALLMDEPFGALDAQTRMAMQELLLEVWQRLSTTVVFVTHDIDEAILLADRVCVMSARPACIAREIPIDLRRPRSIDDLTSPAFIRYKAEIMAEMRSAHQAAEPIHA